MPCDCSVRRAASNTTNLGNSLTPQSKTALFTSGNSSGHTTGGSSKQALRQGPSHVTHNYHLHTHQSATNIAALLNAESSSSGHHNNAYGEQDVSQWKRTLLMVLEEERTAMVSLPDRMAGKPAALLTVTLVICVMYLYLCR